MRRGTNELGLDTKWRFGFCGPGSVLAAAPEAVVLDVGNHLGPGLIDQHQDGSLGRSTSELIFKHPELVYDHLVGPWLDAERGGAELHGRSWQPRIITHRSPDFDGIVSAWLVQQLVATGGFPAGSEALFDYSAEVDQGRYRIDPQRPETWLHAVHMAVLVLASVGGGSDEEVMSLGIGLIDHFMATVGTARSGAGLQPARAARDLWPGQPGVGDWRGDARFAALVRTLETDLDEFKSKDQPNGYQVAVELPLPGSSQTVQVPAFVLRSPPQSQLHKYWVRAWLPRDAAADVGGDGRLGVPMYICPYPGHVEQQVDSQDGEFCYPRVIISLDAAAPAPGEPDLPCLRGLGALLEQVEQQHRRASSTGDERSGRPRWPEPWCVNDDPWYDGRGHGHRIVDSPRSGTRLPYSTVVQLATETTFWGSQAPPASG